MPSQCRCRVHRMIVGLELPLEPQSGTRGQRMETLDLTQAHASASEVRAYPVAVCLCHRRLGRCRSRGLEIEVKVDVELQVGGGGRGKDSPEGSNLS